MDPSQQRAFKWDWRFHHENYKVKKLLKNNLRRQKHKEVIDGSLKETISDWQGIHVINNLYLDNALSHYDTINPRNK